jgi:TonB family protein
MKMKKLVLSFSILIIGHYGYTQDTKSIKALSIEKQPSTPAFYPGGDEKLYAFIQKNLVYPDSAKNNNIEGVVYVKFIIDTLGKVNQPIIMRSANPLLDNEALRVVAMFPNFNPATKDSKKVNTELVLPFNFTLDE